MSELTEYFVRHYTLVLDNNQGSYLAATDIGVRAVRQSDITRRKWLGMSVTDRNKRFADDIGSEILDMIAEACEETLPGNDSLGELLMREIMIFSSGEIGYALGCHYLPEDSAIVDLLDDDDDADDE